MLGEEEAVWLGACEVRAWQGTGWQLPPHAYEPPKLGHCMASPACVTSAESAWNSRGSNSALLKALPFWGFADKAGAAVAGPQGILQ